MYKEIKVATGKIEKHRKGIFSSIEFSYAGTPNENHFAINIISRCFDGSSC